MACLSFCCNVVLGRGPRESQNRPDLWNLACLCECESRSRFKRLTCPRGSVPTSVIMMSRGIVTQSILNLSACVPVCTYLVPEQHSTHVSCYCLTTVQVCPRWQLRVARAWHSHVRRTVVPKLMGCLKAV